MTNENPGYGSSTYLALLGGEVIRTEAGDKVFLEVMPLLKRAVVTVEPGGTALRVEKTLKHDHPIRLMH